MHLFVSKRTALLTAALAVAAVVGLTEAESASSAGVLPSSAAASSLAALAGNPLGLPAHPPCGEVVGAGQATVSVGVQTRLAVCLSAQPAWQVAGARIAVIAAQDVPQPFSNDGTSGVVTSVPMPHESGGEVHATVSLTITNPGDYIIAVTFDPPRSSNPDLGVLAGIYPFRAVGEITAH